MENLESAAVVINCVFSGNFAWGYGGGIHNRDSYPTLTNCTFSRNNTDLQGGGMYSYDCRPVVTNCIFWDNNSVGDGNEIYNNDADPFFGYCDIKDSGGSGDWDANLGIDLGGNIDADPCFVDAGNPDGNDGIFRTLDDGLRLTIDGNCIDAADGDAAPLAGGILGYGRADVKDIDNTGIGEPNCADIGAYEYFPKLVHFTGALMNDKYRWLCYSEAFVDNFDSDILGPGDYNDTEAAIPKAVYWTFDGIAIHPGLRVIIYSEKDFEGEVLLDKEGPAIINNVRYIGGYDADHLPYYATINKAWYQPLQSEFPQVVREWSETDMYDNNYWWGHGSFKIEALYP